MLNCNQVTRLISESQDRKLSMGEQWSLRMHVFFCSGCRNFNEQVPFIRLAMRAWPSENDEPIK